MYWPKIKVMTDSVNVRNDRYVPVTGSILGLKLSTWYLRHVL